MILFSSFSFCNYFNVSWEWLFWECLYGVSLGFLLRFFPRFIPKSLRHLDSLLISRSSHNLILHQKIYRNSKCRISLPVNKKNRNPNLHLFWYPKTIFKMENLFLFRPWFRWTAVLSIQLSFHLQKLKLFLFDYENILPISCRIFFKDFLKDSLGTLFNIHRRTSFGVALGIHFGISPNISKKILSGFLYGILPGIPARISPMICAAIVSEFLSRFLWFFFNSTNVLFQWFLQGLLLTHSFINDSFKDFSSCFQRFFQEFLQQVFPWFLPEFLS